MTEQYYKLSVNIDYNCDSKIKHHGEFYIFKYAFEEKEDKSKEGKLELIAKENTSPFVYRFIEDYNFKEDSLQKCSFKLSINRKEIDGKEEMLEESYLFKINNETGDLEYNKISPDLPCYFSSFNLINERDYRILEDSLDRDIKEHIFRISV